MMLEIYHITVGSIIIKKKKEEGKKRSIIHVEKKDD